MYGEYQNKWLQKNRFRISKNGPNNKRNIRIVQGLKVLYSLRQTCPIFDEKKLKIQSSMEVSQLKDLTQFDKSSCRICQLKQDEFYFDCFSSALFSCQFESIYMASKVIRIIKLSFKGNIIYSYILIILLCSSGEKKFSPKFSKVG